MTDQILLEPKSEEELRVIASDMADNVLKYDQIKDEAAKKAKKYRDRLTQIHKDITDAAKVLKENGVVID
jgi:hypothetical protein